MAFADIVRRDLLALISEVPQKFQFKGAEYTGTVGGERKTVPLEIGGFEPRPQKVLVVNLRNAEGGYTFGQDSPQPNDRVIVNGETYIIETTERDEFGEALQMELRNPHK